MPGWRYRVPLLQWNQWNPAQFGPFTGGLNTYSDPSSIDDTELVDLVNMELDLDGSLASRPPIQHITTDTGMAWATRLVMRAIVTFPQGQYIIGVASNGTYYKKTTDFNWTLMYSSLAGAVMQYNGKVWLIGFPGFSGGNWDPVAGFTAIPALPTGTAARIYKDRLWVAPNSDSRLRFSEAGDFTTWPASNFIDISKGDGQTLNNIVVYKTNLILFKDDSTYVYSYNTAPSDGVVEPLSPTIGTNTSLVEYVNSVFIFHRGRVYELSNSDFTVVNTKVPFTTDTSTPSQRGENVFMCRMNNRMIVRYYNKVYVYNFLNQTWCRWESAQQNLHNFGFLVGIPSPTSSDRSDVFYCGSNLEAVTSIFKIQDKYDATSKEQYNGVNFDITCNVITKNFDMNVSYMYKRLFSWEADVLTNRDTIGTVNVNFLPQRETWGDFINRNIPWNATGTWDKPITGTSAVTNTVLGSGVPDRKMLKFPRSVRFRKINFGLTMLTNGSTQDGPCRIYTITANTRLKEFVTKDAT